MSDPNELLTPETLKMLANDDLFPRDGYWNKILAACADAWGETQRRLEAAEKHIARLLEAIHDLDLADMPSDDVARVLAWAADSTAPNDVWAAMNASSSLSASPR